MDPYILTIDNVLDDQTCDALVDQFRGDSRVEADPQPDYSNRRFLYLSDKPEWRKILMQVSIKTYELVDTYFDHINSGVSDWLDDGYVLAHYRPGDDCVLHDDGQTTEDGRNGLRLVTLLYFLGDTGGGETVFPNQGVRVSPKKGRVVMFPAQLTHPHEVLPTVDDRFILQTWICDANLVVNSRD